MKLFLATVSNVSDRHKEQEHWISHLSAHTTYNKAVEAVMTSIVKEHPKHFADFPIDFGRILPGRELHESRNYRIREYLENCYGSSYTGSYLGWEQDDCKEMKKGELDAFKERERKVVTAIGNELRTYFSKNETIPFTRENLTMPVLKANYFPTLWKIVETEIDIESRGTKRGIDDRQQAY